MPKQLAHSSRAMYLSLSKSQASKKRVVQCSMGMSGARSGASSVWDRYLQRFPCSQYPIASHGSQSGTSALILSSYFPSALPASTNDHCGGHGCVSAYVASCASD